MMIILITGANRGLGFEFTKQYLQVGHQVIATCRDPSNATDLNALGSQYPNKLSIFSLDVSNQKSREIFKSNIEEKINYLDLLINNAGIISGGVNRNYPLGELYSEDILSVLNTNSVSPLLMTESLLHLLKKSGNAKVINISSTMGSIGQKSGTSNYSYCASKTALNMISKMLSIDLKEYQIAVLALHPGWVQTDMGTSAAPIIPSRSISGMIEVIKDLTIENSGEFRDFQGDLVPW